VYYKTRDEVIRRTLNVPADCTFTELHRVIYIAFQWDDSHCWKFNVKDGTEMRTRKQRWDTGDLLNIRHLNRSSRRSRDPPALEADTTTIGTILEDAQYKGKILEYIWDFGQNWDHVITVQGRRPRNAHITLVEAKGKTPSDVAPFIHPMFTERDRQEIVERLAAMDASRGQEGAHTPYQWLGEESDDEDDPGIRQAKLDRDRIAQRLADMEVPRVLDRAPMGQQQAAEIPSTTLDGVKSEVGGERDDDGGRRQAERDRDRMAQHLASMEAPRVLKRARIEHQQEGESSSTTEGHQEKRTRVEVA